MLLFQSLFKLAVNCMIMLNEFSNKYVKQRKQLQLEQSDSDKGPRIMPCIEKGIYVLATIQIQT